MLLSIKASDIHGFGVFTVYPMEAGVAIKFDVPEISDERYKRLQEKCPAEKEFFLTTDDKIYDIRNSILRFLNHSKDPNLMWINGLSIIPLRDISANEELTINYGWDKYIWEKITEALE